MAQEVVAAHTGAAEGAERELKRSRAEFEPEEESSWCPGLELDSCVSAKRRAVLSHASKLFLEMQTQVRSRIAELRAKDERERMESLRIAELHPIQWPESPRLGSSSEEGKHKEQQTQEDFCQFRISQPGTPETVVQTEEGPKGDHTPNLCPVKESSKDKQQLSNDRAKQLVFAAGFKSSHDRDQMPAISI